MKQNLTEMVFVLDRSGSMSGKEADVVGGFNSLIEQQKGLAGEAFVTTVLFDDRYELLHDHVDLKSIVPLTNEYAPRGMTALLDAVGKTIDDVGKRLSDTPEAERPAKVVFVIMTDGLENASRRYSQTKVREMIEHQKTKYSWEFVFLGANIDAIETARDMGISYERAAQFEADSEGIDEGMRCLGNFVACCRESPIKRDEKPNDAWKEFLKRHERKKK